MRAATVLIMSTLLAAPASAESVSFNLSLQVPVRCSVHEVKSLKPERGLVTVDASCNATDFALLMGGDLGRLPVRSVTVANAETSVRNNRIHVRPERPGRYVFVLDYGTSLRHIHSAPVNIQTL